MDVEKAFDKSGTMAYSTPYNNTTSQSSSYGSSAASSPTGIHISKSTTPFQTSSKSTMEYHKVHHLAQHSSSSTQPTYYSLHQQYTYHNSPTTLRHTLHPKISPNYKTNFKNHSTEWQPSVENPGSA